jgi:hypothetical protein
VIFQKRTCITPLLLDLPKISVTLQVTRLSGFSLLITCSLPFLHHALGLIFGFIVCSIRIEGVWTARYLVQLIFDPNSIKRFILPEELRDSVAGFNSLASTCGVYGRMLSVCPSIITGHVTLSFYTLTQVCICFCHLKLPHI